MHKSAAEPCLLIDDKESFKSTTQSLVDKSGLKASYRQMLLYNCNLNLKLKSKELFCT